MLYEDKVTILIKEAEEDELRRFLNEYRDVGYERRIKRMREDYLSEHKERFVELMVFIIATKDEFPKSFEELEALADEENKKSVAIAKEAFEDNLIEALCSIKGDVPACLLDEYAAILIKLGKNLYFNDAQQDWYKKMNVKPVKNFDVKEKEYVALYGSPLNFEKSL